MVSLVEIYPGRATTYQFHSEITIGGNSGFTSANGVVSGAGTVSSPYVIEGWNIAYAAGPSIWVHDTDAYFVIERVYACSQYGASIDLWNVTHGVVQDSQFPKCATGPGGISIRLVGSKDIKISNNNLEEETALNLYRSSNLTISGNYVKAGNSTIGSPIAGPTQVYVDHSNNSVFTGNNMLGVILQMTGSKGNLAYHNNFLERCTYYCPVIGGASDDQPGVNFWDHGYPSGGNYWVNYTGADQCSGPNQDVCNGPDGIADRPYHFRNATDKYPLMKAYGDQAPPTWTSSKTLTAQSIGETSLGLQWSGGSDDLEVAGYRIYGNGMFLTSVGRDNTSISITGLSPGTTYTFYIVAVDVANTTSVDGPSLNVNTLPLWWQITSPVWWRLNWFWGVALLGCGVAIIALMVIRGKGLKQKRLTDFSAKSNVMPMLTTRLLVRVRHCVWLYND